MHIIEVTNDELVDAITRRAKELGITHGVVVSLIGAVDSFTVSTMPRNDATRDTITRYDMPAEMTGTGDVTDGAVHLHVVMGVEGDRAIAGHLHQAHVATWFARAYLQPYDSRS